ncbi:MAG: tRNA uridine-5-carboxymethylaminomethyl(34) synthesis GTPase MnmE [Verrucomicrobia bacterium]|nr:tRNA uridine-5-carboxymethylaminomethyl(34) synthesis GTPase MnmE [Verrucomicrobiota bacterium]
MNASTIAAIASPPGTGAVSLIRLSGSSAKTIAAETFSGRSSTAWVPRQQHFGRICNLRGEVIDEVLLTWFPGPKSFTGEDVVEIACHGGVLVTRRVLECLVAAGAVPAAPGEFSERAFLNGRLDLTQAEAIMDLISARTDLALRAAREQLGGLLGREVEAIRLDLVGLVAHVEAHIDFPEEDIAPDSTAAMLGTLDAIHSRVSRLLATADQGRLLREGIRTVICGPPNAGKSSLLNRLLGYDRAIVSGEAGTTRDTIEEGLNLKGIPLRLIDTAGIREAEGSIEREGIARSRAEIGGAELILFVVDASVSSRGVEPVIAPPGARLLRLLNKADLPRHPDWEDAAGIPVSCLESDSIDAFRDRLFDLVTSGKGLETGDLTSINARHQACLGRAGSALGAARGLLAAGESPEFVAEELRAALDAVGEVVGKTEVEEILGEIFGRFCIGK